MGKRGGKTRTSGNTSTKGKPHRGRPATLTPKEYGVIDEYFSNGFKRLEALRSAGYTNPDGISWQFFNRPLVVAEIERRRLEKRKKFDINEDLIIQELAAVALMRAGELLEVNEDGTAYMDLTGLTDAQRAAVAEFTVDEYQDGKGDDAREVKKVKVKFHSKLDALDKLARYLGLFEKDNSQKGGLMELEKILAERRNHIARDKQKE